jgi:Helix-turn-helix
MKKNRNIPMRAETDSDLHVISLFNQNESFFGFPPPSGVQIIRKPSEISSAHNLIVLSSCNHLIDIAPYISTANHRNALRALLLRNDSSPHWTTRFLYNSGLHALRNLLVHSGTDIPKRIIEAWAAGAQHKLIADATVHDNKLLVLDCALKLYELPFGALRELNKIPIKNREQFSIDKDGSDIFWRDYDIRIDIESIESVLNPEKFLIQKFAHDRKFGQAIAAFRNLKGLKQSDILGLTERQVRRIEKGEQNTTLKSLNVLAKAHKLSLKNYLNQVAECV